MLCHESDYLFMLAKYSPTQSCAMSSSLFLPLPSMPTHLPTQRHHFAQTVCILNSEGCNIFENLSHKENEQMLDLIRYIILSTDITHHLHLMKSIEEMAKGQQ